MKKHLTLFLVLPILLVHLSVEAFNVVPIINLSPAGSMITNLKLTEKAAIHSFVYGAAAHKTYIIKASGGSPDGLYKPDLSYVMPGDTIILQGHFDMVSLENIHGSSDEPIVVKGAADVNIGGYLAYTFEVDNSDYFTLDNLKINAAGNNIVMAIGNCTHYEISNCDIAGGSIGMALKQDPSCDPSTWNYGDTARVLQYINVHDNYIHNTSAEAIYAGFTHNGHESSEPDSGWIGSPRSCQFNGRDTTFRLPAKRLGHVHIWNNRISNTGFDGIQVNDVKYGWLEIDHNTVNNVGLSRIYGQNFGFSLGGSVKMYVHDNDIENGTCSGMQIYGYTDSLILVNNTIRYMENDGIYLISGIPTGKVPLDADSTKAFIYNNKISDVKLSGINLTNYSGYFSQQSQVYNNNISAGTVPLNNNNNHPPISWEGDYGGTPLGQLAVYPPLNLKDIYNKYPTANAGPDITTSIDSITLKATAGDIDGKIEKVFWALAQGNNKAATIENPDSLVTTVKNLKAGTYMFEFVATDDQGAKTTSTVMVTVDPQSNEKPVTKVNKDTTIILPSDSATLDGSSSYDPDGKIVSYQWEKQSGPSSYNIENATSARTEVNGLSAGTYVFVLTATDDKGASSSSAVTIVVEPAANKAPVADAGGDATIRLPEDSITLDGSGSTDADGKVVSYQWEKQSGPSSYNIENATSARTEVNGLSAGTYVFALTATDDKGASSSSAVTIVVDPAANKAPEAKLAASTIAITLPLDSVSLDGSNSADADGNIVSYKWSQESGPSLVDLVKANSAQAEAVGFKAGSYSFKLVVTDDGGLSSSATVTVNVTAAPDQSPVVLTNSDTTITLPDNTITLDGSSSYDPDGKIVSYQWSNYQNLPYNIENENAAVTKVSGLAAGQYVFELFVVDDQGAKTGAKVRVTVKAAPVVVNKAPVSDAGGDATIRLPEDSITLDGSGSTDADGKIVSYQWDKQSGPSSYNIENATSARTEVNGLSAGTYVFVLTATDDKGASSSSAVTIVVEPAANKAPVAKPAAATIAITLPLDSVSLDGSNSADADGNIVSYKWSQESGPSVVDLVKANSAQAEAVGFKAGSYSFKLVVTDDGGLSSSATVIVNVTAAPDQPPVAKVSADSLTVVLPQSSILLDGSASYDPDGTIVSYLWKEVSGPAAVNFNPADSAKTRVEKLTTGIYHFTLKVVDNNGAAATITVVLTVHPANKFPIAKAQADYDSITLPENKISLSAAGSKDPDGTIVSYIWSQLSGPSQAEIGKPEAIRTSVNNLKAGTYEFQLRITDNDGASDSVLATVIVNPVPNKPPTANAGADIIITLPETSVKLNASNSYDPDGKIVSYHWKKLLGPTNFSIINADAAETKVEDLTAGKYIFIVTVIDDEGDKDEDSVTVSVLDNANKTPVADAGKDTSVVLPDNTIILDATNSYDPDGTLVNYSWKELSGPSQFKISYLSTSKAFVKGLTAGIYQFLLTVTDDRGATATDTVNIYVVNHDTPPVANAGTDTTIYFPVNTIDLDAGNSYDADGVITDYNWSTIGGPHQVKIIESTQSKLHLADLAPGNYMFKVTVTDNNQLTASDTVALTVSTARMGAAHAVIVYPNPAHSTTNIRMYGEQTGRMSVTFYNDNGIAKLNMIYNKQGKYFDQSIDISNLTKGIYFVKIQIANYTVTKKLVKIE